MKVSAYRKFYTDEALWAKLGKYALAAGQTLVHKALTLYYAMLSPETPPWARAAILGALGYFILPLDVVPDLIPGVGYGDDLGALATAAATVAAHVRPEHGQKAKETMKKWFRA